MKNRNPLRIVIALGGLFAGFSARADNWAPNITVSGAWHSNATLADQTADQVDSLQLGTDIVASQRYTFGGADSAALTLHGGADWWPRYRGLLAGALGGRAEWQHTFGSGPRAPIVALKGFGDFVATDEAERRGVAYGAILALRKPFTDAMRGTIAHELSWFDARHGVFDRTTGETSLEFENDFNPRTRLTLAVRHRDGDIVSYATAPRLDLAALAPNRVDLATFDRAMTAYRLEARTWTWRLAVTRALDDDSAIVLGYEWRSHRRGDFKATNNVLSVALVTQF